MKRKASPGKRIAVRVRRNASVLLLITVFLSAAYWVASPPRVQGISSGVVISQVYGGGGNSLATFTHDFIELFNRGASPVSLNGWSVQYASATGTGNFAANSTMITELPNVTLAPGQYFLIREASTAAVGSPLPTPDATDATPIAMAAGAGKVALVNTTTPLGCNGGSTACTPAALATIVDLVGYGNANFFEGAGAAPTLTNTTAAFRALGGCTDTDNNASDFAAATPNPRNTSSPLNTCVGDGAPLVSSTSPLNGATNVALNASITVNFSENVNVGANWFTIVGSLSGSHTATVTGGPMNFTLNPGTDFVNSETVTVTIVASEVTDTDVDDPPDNMSADFVFSFTTVAPPPPFKPIHEIQGATHTSPFNTTMVSTSGIVTAKRGNGFYLQDPVPDSDDATSEAIFVFTSSAPTVSVGDAVNVVGTVSEFRPGGASSDNLTTTELTSPSISVTSSGNPLPAPIVIGIGGRIPPSMVIEDDATGNVETSGVFDPSTDGIDFYESLEAMRVQVNNAVVTGPNVSFGEIPVLSDDGANASVRTTRDGIVVRSNDFNPERIFLDDEIASTPTVVVGDHFTGPIVGVMDYSFGNFKLEVTSSPTAVPGGLSQEVTAAPTANQLAVATFNVENLDANDPPAKFSDLAGVIINNLQSPDLIALEEIQDNNGASGGGGVDATQTYNQLIAAILAAGGPTYEFRQIDPVNNQDGGEPNGNIRVGFLFRTDRGLAFIDRPGGTSTGATTVVNGASGPEVSFSPGRIDPTNPAFNNSRKPLVGEFTFNCHSLFVIANHFISKGGDDPLFGRFQPPTLSSEVQRIQQAQVVNDFVDSILALDPNAEVVTLGDLNDFEFSAPLNTLKGGVLHDLIESLPQSERYTYVFEGNSQALDHILLSDSLFNGIPAFDYDVVHVNSEFVVRTSDHDPQVVRLTLADTIAPVITGASANPSVLSPPNHKLVPVTINYTATDNCGPVTCTLSVTSNEPVNGVDDGNTSPDWIVLDAHNVNLRAERSGSGSGRVYTITITCTDGAGNSSSQTVTVTVPLKNQ
ncbi:MAG: lamin tail domain-containing protein [Acidobacteriota bacterium]